MKTPVAITGFSGLFLAMLWLAGSVQGQTKDPLVSTSNANGSPQQTIVAEGAIAYDGSTLPSKLQLSPWAKEIVKLAQSGIDENVMIAFIDNAGMFKLEADQIIYLSDIGVSANTINAMLEHDHDLASGVRQSTVVTEPPTEAYDGVKLVIKRGGADGSVEEIPATRAALAALRESSAVQEKAVSVSNPAAAQAPTIVEPLLMENPPVTPRTPAPAPETSSPGTKPSLYPVREPFPVELVPPIIFVNTPEIHPNTIVVYGFSKS
jgi:hypothetical protein